jgi:hypothetical protein
VSVEAVVDDEAALLAFGEQPAGRARVIDLLDDVVLEHKHHLAIAPFVSAGEGQKLVPIAAE